ncbi:MAG: hypothetical protein ACODAC_06310 [Pseudomonadota bacterium]
MTGRSTRRRALCAWVALAGLAMAGSAVAQVTLDTRVGLVTSPADGEDEPARALTETDTVEPGDELRYTIIFSNDGEVPVEAERIVVTNPVPEGTRYVPGSAGGDATRIEYSRDGERFSGTEPAEPRPAEARGEAADPGVRSIRWTYQEALAPGASSEVHFHVIMQ